MINKKNSVAKRIRQTAARRLQNRYYGRTTRNMVKKVRMAATVSEAEALYPQTVANLDKLAKRGIIHKNKASNIKSKLAKHINAMRASA